MFVWSLYQVKDRVVFVFLSPKSSSIKGGAKVYSCEYRKHKFILVLLFINCCIIFHKNTCKPSFSPPCILDTSRLPE